MRKLGKLGESTFQSLCATAGITCNKSYEDDETGWDFFIEFPFDFLLPFPMDMQPAPLTCLIQVKSTDNFRKAVQIKLSNMLRLVKAPMPAFIIVFDFSEKNKPRLANLVHIEQALIELSLKKIRELESIGERRINRHKITIPLDSSGNVKPVEAKSLFKKLEDCVPRPFEDYAQRKKEIVQRIGFSEHWGKGHVTFGATQGDSLAELVDIMLGLKSQVDVSSFSMSSVRFGIEIEHPTLNSGKLTITPNPVGVCRINFLTPTDELSLEGKIYIPAIPGLPEKYRKVKIETEVLRFVIGVGDKETKLVDFNLTPKGNEQTTPIEISKFFKVMQALIDGTIELAVHADGKKILDGKLNSLKQRDDKNWKIPEKIMGSFVKLLRDQPCAYRLSINEVLKNLRQLDNFVHSTANGESKMNISLMPSRNFNWSDAHDKRMGCMIPVIFSIGERHLVAIVLQDGIINSTLAMTDSSINIEVSIKNREVIEVFDVSGSNEVLEKEISRRFGALENSPKKNGFQFFFTSQDTKLDN